MKKTIFTIIILILIILGSCFKTDKDNSQDINIIEKDTIVTPPPTIDEIIKNGFENIHSFTNHGATEHMDRALAKTISGFSYFTENLKPDLIVVHGDRIEALAGALVGSLNN